MSKLIATILAILIVVGAVVLGFVFFRSNPKVKIITITKEAKFDPTELKISNDEVLKIKNDDSKKHTIRNTKTNTNLVTDLEPKKTSGEIVFDDNSRNQIALVDNKDVTSAVLVGNAPAATTAEQKPFGTEQTTTPANNNAQTNQPSQTNQNNQSAQTNQTPASSQPAVSQNKPLPNTGSELYIYPLALLAGLLALGWTRRIVISFPKYKVDFRSKRIFVKQTETLLVSFPQKLT